MGLSEELLSQFAKIATPVEKKKPDTTVYGRVSETDGKMYVQLDGSDILTPVATTVRAKSGDRVRVSVKRHTAVITGNITSPSANGQDIDDVWTGISEFENIVAGKIDVDELYAVYARIEELVAENVTITGELEANKAEIDELKAHDVEIDGNLSAANAEIEDLKVTKLDADVADLKYATVGDLEATNAYIHNLEVDYGEFKELTVDNFTAVNGTIENLDSKYANIDFANIGKAAIEEFFAQSGIIKDLVVGDGTVTGELIGVTIKGDLIEGNTIVADKLVIKGADGLYYKLNTDGMKTEAEQTKENSLDGSVITAKSIAATKISVKDLVAFNATVGGFKLTVSSIYSGVKESVENTTRGIYLDKDGQFAVGDADNYLKYYKDTDGTYKLAVSAESISFGVHGGKVEEAVIDTIEEFYQSDSPTELTGGKWSETQPTWTQGKYIWRRTLIKYMNGTSSYSPSSDGVCITGNTGADGGGSDTQIVVGFETEFYLSTSGTKQTGGSWSTSRPSWEAGKYLWTRSKITYENPSDIEYTTPVCDIGTDAAKEAEKVATNFMNYDSTNGLVIGNKISGTWSGYRTQITSSNFNILNQSGTVLASYGSDTIYLGKNSSNSVINLCNGKGILQYHSDKIFSNNYIELYGTNAAVRGTEYASMYVHYSNSSGYLERSAITSYRDGVKIEAYQSYNYDESSGTFTGDSAALFVTPAAVELYGYDGNVNVEAFNNVNIKAVGGSLKTSVVISADYSGKESTLTVTRDTITLDADNIKLVGGRYGVRLECPIYDENNSKLVSEDDLDALDTGTVFKLITRTKSVTMPANSNKAFDMGAITAYSGYTLMGFLPQDNGYGDQWTVTYARYGSENHLYAYVKSYYGASLNATLKCVVVYAKNGTY